MTPDGNARTKTYATTAIRPRRCCLKKMHHLFDITGQTAVITGGSGVLGRAMASALADAGAQVAVLGRRAETFAPIVASIAGSGGLAIGVACDVRDRLSLEAAARDVERALGPVNILVNAAGGNNPQATTAPEQPFWSLDASAMRDVVDLNLLGTVLPCQIWGRQMAERGSGSIVNIASMAALRPLTRVAAYAAAKAAVVNFTQWLAVYVAREYDPRVRVNAIAPGFFLTDQNRYLLIDRETGRWTERGRAIIEHTPAARLGQPDDLAGALLWLVSPAASFVTGTVVPVDGGFAAFGGV